METKQKITKQYSFNFHAESLRCKDSKECLIFCGRLSDWKRLHGRVLSLKELLHLKCKQGVTLPERKINL